MIAIRTSAAAVVLGLAACASSESPTESSLPELARRAVEYHAIDLGALGGDFNEALDINARGQVVGWNEAGGHVRAVVWANGTMTDLGTLPGGSQSVAEAINPAGDIAGRSWTAEDAELHPVLWSEGLITDLGSFGGREGQATDISPSGEVVGWSETSTGEAHPFLWSRGRLVDLDPLGGRFTLDVGINPAGRVVYGRGGSTDGPDLSHAYEWKRGASTDLGEGLASAINPAGIVVGSHFFSEAGAYHAVTWAQGEMTDLGTLGGSFSAATDVNPAGEVVGMSTTAAGDMHAFIWTGGAMIDLGTLGGPTSFAFGINSAGQVVGSSRLYAESGETHAVLWTRR